MTTLRIPPGFLQQLRHLSAGAAITAVVCLVILASVISADYALLTGEGSTSSGYCREADGVRHGTYIQDFSIKTDAACRQACDDDTTCQGYELYFPATGSAGHRCELHSGEVCAVRTASDGLCYVNLDRWAIPCPNVSPPPPPRYA